jgi:hypothetical protein
VADLLAFASDVSGGDAEVVKAVRRWLEAPPTAPEEIGFYGDADSTPSAWRQWLATVSLLARRDHIMGFEDKYCDELLDVLENRGLLAFDDLPTDAQAVWSIIADGFDCDADGQPHPAQLETLWHGYAAAAAAAEQAVRAGGKVLVSIDATDGDTMFFAALAPEVAERWIGTGFAAVEADGSGHAAGVRAPQWGRLWDNLLYALDDIPEEFEARGWPPGLADEAPLRF